MLYLPKHNCQAGEIDSYNGYDRQSPRPHDLGDCRLLLFGNCSSGVNIGSQAGSIVGFCLSTSRTFAGTYFLSTTRRNIYSLNHAPVIMSVPLKPDCAPQLFSICHILGFSSLSRSTDIGVVMPRNGSVCNKGLKWTNGGWRYGDIFAKLFENR